MSVSNYVYTDANNIANKSCKGEWSTRSGVSRKRKIFPDK